MYGLVVTTPGAVEPVTLAELKGHMRIDGDEDNAQITIYNAAARGTVERYLNRQLITATFQYTLEQFPRGEFILPRPPLISVDTIQYVDTAGDTQTWASGNYQVDTNQEPGRVKPVTTASYPSTQSDTYNAVTVAYDAGYGAATTDVPQSVRDAIMMFAAQLYEFREPIISGTIIATVPDHIKALLGDEKVPII